MCAPGPACVHPGPRAWAGTGAQCAASCQGTRPYVTVHVCVCADVPQARAVTVNGEWVSGVPTWELLCARPHGGRVCTMYVSVVHAESGETMCVVP